MRVCVAGEREETSLPSQLLSGISLSVMAFTGVTGAQNTQLMGPSDFRF